MEGNIKILTGLALVSVVATGLLALPVEKSEPQAVNQSKGTYLTLVSASSIHNGDFYTNAGTRLNFNEEGVILVSRFFADAIIGWWTVANVMRTPIESPVFRI